MPRKISGEARDQMDLQILIGITGCESPMNLGYQIEDDYLRREYYENQREAGFEVPEEYQPVQRSEKERALWRSEKLMEQLEQSRTNLPEMEYLGGDEEDGMERVKKDMGFVDNDKLSKEVFETFVNIKQVKNKEGKWFTVITIGKDQDKVFLVTARKDGNGVSLITDWDEYMKETLTTVKKETVKI